MPTWAYVCVYNLCLYFCVRPVTIQGPLHPYELSCSHSGFQLCTAPTCASACPPRMSGVQPIKCGMRISRRGAEGFGAIQANVEVQDYGRFTIHGHCSLSDMEHFIELHPQRLGPKATWKRGNRWHTLRTGDSEGSSIWMDYEVTSWCRLPSVTGTAASAEDGAGAESSSPDDLEPSEIAALSSEISLAPPSEISATAAEMPAPATKKRRRQHSNA